MRNQPIQSVHISLGHRLCAVRIVIGDSNSDYATLAIFLYISALFEVLSRLLKIFVAIHLAQIEFSDEFILNRGAIEHVHEQSAGTFQSQQIARDIAQTSAQSTCHSACRTAA